MNNHSNIASSRHRWNGDHDEEAIPVVDAVRSRDGKQLVIICPYCGKKHHHGAVSERVGAGNGHRVAHCAIRTGVNDRGYVVVEVGSSTEADQW
jgi:hypothetical protein